MTVVVSTDDVPEGEQLAFLDEMMRQMFFPLAVAPLEKDSWFTAVAADQVGYLTVSAVRGAAMRFRRTPRLVATAGEEFVIVGLQHAGTAVGVQDGREALLRPGDLAFWDAGRPWDFQTSDDYRQTVFVIPRTYIGLSEDDLRQITGIAIPPTDGIAALATPFLTRLAEHSDTLARTGGDRVAAGAVALLEGLAAEIGAGNRPELESTGAALLLRIRSFIAHRLADPELSPETIARAHHISVRYLHKLFQSEETSVQRWILRRRLEECRRELARPERMTGAISAIAHRWGFTDASHFSRAFRAAFGVAPRQWRELATTRGE